MAAAADRQKVKLALARDQRLREIDLRQHDDLAALAGAAAAAGQAAAPGAAGDAVGPLAADPGRPGESAPELRVGRLLLPYDGEVPALVPLLDRGHVVVRGDDRLGDEVVAGLLLRALGTRRTPARSG